MAAAEASPRRSRPSASFRLSSCPRRAATTALLLDWAAFPLRNLLSTVDRWLLWFCRELSVSEFAAPAARASSFLRRSMKSSYKRDGSHAALFCGSSRVPQCSKRGSLPNSVVQVRAHSNTGPTFSESSRTWRGSEAKNRGRGEAAKLPQFFSRSRSLAASRRRVKPL